ncbi:MAG: 5-formyltetrahydrofolate cyclo-ligase [Thiotrichales bacterium]|nr:MAG: 5-formyltetrahydrofolate cyclo-ligase [Thiotrichales bacterium]
MECTSKSQLRKQFIDKRNCLTALQIAAASKIIAHTITALTAFQQARHIALYWPCNNEINTLDILASALKLNKKCYLPIISPDDSTLIFQEINSLTPNLPKIRRGIPELLHDPQRTRHASELDLVIVPLLAFDANNIRLGMGAGHYDKTFAFKLTKLQATPTLVGIAHQAQYSNDLLPCDPWDIPLDYIITAQGTYSL